MFTVSGISLAWPARGGLVEARALQQLPQTVRRGCKSRWLVSRRPCIYMSPFWTRGCNGYWWRWFWSQRRTVIKAVKLFRRWWQICRRWRKLQISKAGLKDA
jgi:hypothetical protein